MEVLLKSDAQSLGTRNLQARTATPLHTRTPAHPHTRTAANLHTRTTGARLCTMHPCTCAPLQVGIVSLALALVCKAPPYLDPDLDPDLGPSPDLL